MASSRLNARNFTFKGLNVEANVNDFKADFFDFHSTDGRFEANHIIVNRQANISLETGDIIY